MYFLSVVKFYEEDESGTLVEKKEEILLSAESYTDAEARLFSIMEENGVNDFTIDSLVKTKVDDIILNEGQDANWFKVKTAFITQNERTGKEKAFNSVAFVNADDHKGVISSIEDLYAKILVPWELKELKRTKIVEVFLDESKKKPESEDPKEKTVLDVLMSGATDNSDTQKPHEK